MIELYRPLNCSFSDQIEEILKELVVAHRIHVVDEVEEREKIPRLREGRRAYHSKEEIQALLAEIGYEMLLQREMQSDSCKIDPESGKGCL